MREATIASKPTSRTAAALKPVAAVRVEEAGRRAAGSFHRLESGS
jgi:hypothetical protein